MARRALGLRARGAGRLAFEINGRPKTEPGLQARSPFCLHCLSMNQNGPLRLRSGPFLRKGKMCIRDRFTPCSKLGVRSGHFFRVVRHRASAMPSKQEETLRKCLVRPF